MHTSMSKCNCQFFRFGRCRLAEQLSGVRRVAVAEDACTACQRTTTPETGETNHVVASLARRAARGLPQDAAVIEATRPYLTRRAARTPDADLLQVLRCPYRGEQVGERPCLLCGRAGTTEPVYSCSVHGSATLRKYRNGRQDEAVCLVCPERLRPE